MLARNVQREIERDVNLQSEAAMANSDAGTSSGSAGGGKYQVFLNFCGRDTRDGFTSFLHRDLRKDGIHAFMDDEELRVGEEIGGELLRAIEDSQIYVPIFSENYASRKWCLRELVRMVDNISKSNEKKILPIFYYVKPDDVDLKTESYRKAMGQLKKEHEKKQREKFPHEVESWEGELWEEALTKVSKIKGWVLEQGDSQAKLVDSVVEKVVQELKTREKFVTKDLVGLDDRVTKVLEMLDVNCSDKARLLGIHGMGGIGKTTLARAVYNELHSCFGKYCAFLDNIREMSEKEGLVSLQKKLLTSIDCSDAAAKSIDDVDYGRKRIGEILGHKKILIVLDDVGEEEQIENLIGQRGLHPGTRVIVTTRNTSVLKFIEQRTAPETKEVNSDPAIRIMPYEMEKMNFDDALELLKRHAALEGSMAKDIDSLSRDIVHTVGGLPLTLKVTGSLLRGEPTPKWENTLERLKTIPHENVLERLKISFDALDRFQRDIFLDIACFFINENIINANYMWQACEFYPDIEVLVKRSLIKIIYNKFSMHDQLRDMGREIVRRENLKDLGERSRLWTSEEVLDLVRTEEKKKMVEALDLTGRSSHISISHEEVGRFNNLRFLRLFNGTLHGDFSVSLPNLRWISWNSPLQNLSVPNMQSKNLVVIELFNNCFTNDSKVWNLTKMATKLKNLTLKGCHGITRTPDLSKCLDLERLTISYCERLKEIDSSIGKVTRLHDLDITDCKLIEHVPCHIRELVKLECFSLRGCRGVSILPTSIGDLASLRKLDLSGTGITILPKSIRKLQCLSNLILQGSRITEIPCEIEGLLHLHLGSMEIKQFPDSIEKLKSLCTLNLSSNGYDSENKNQWKLPKAIGKLEKLEKLNLGCRIELVGEIPDEIGDLSSLRVLDLSSTRICRVPGTINMLSCLSRLDLTRCDEITDLPELPTSLVHLRVGSSSLQVVPNLSKLTNLVNLDLSDHYGNQDSSNLKHKCDLGWIGRLSKLKKLRLYFLNFTAPVPELGLLSLLKDLTLRGLDLQPLKQLQPSLLSLCLHNFSFTGSPLSNLKVLSHLTLRCSRLQEIQLDGLSQLEDLCLSSCELRSLSIPSSLHTLYVRDCPNMIEILFLGMSASLKSLFIHECRSIGMIVLCNEVGSLGVRDQSESSSIEITECSLEVLHLTNAFKKLTYITLSKCENLLEFQVIGTLLSLQKIDIKGCNAMEKVSGVSNLKNLESLLIMRCSKLRVVEGLDELEFLIQLAVFYCPSLETFRDISNWKIPDECKIHVDYCSRSLNDSLLWGPSTFKECKRSAQLGTPHSEKNKEEAKMEGDAIEPDTKLQPQFHPSASSRDHEFSEEPSIDNVTEGTPPKKQNQTMEKDSNPSSLDEVTPSRAFCDTVMTCLASILECVCNRNSPSIKS